MLKKDDGADVASYTFAAKVQDKSEEEGAEPPKMTLNKYRDEANKKTVKLLLLERDASALKAFRAKNADGFVRFPKELVTNDSY